METFPNSSEKIPTSIEKAPQTRVVVMLGARMIRAGGGDNWHFPLFSPGSVNPQTGIEGEVSGGDSRMRAIESQYDQELAEGKDMKVFVTGGKETKSGNGESRAEEAAKKLVSKYHLDASAVIALPGQGSTVGNAESIAQYLQAHTEELGNVKDIEIVTNRYHMLRAWFMFSIALRRVTANLDTAISKEDQQEVEGLLDAALSEETSDPNTIKSTQDEIIGILSKYFSDSAITVTPRVVEDTLRESDEPGRIHYADLLESNENVRLTVKAEYEGIKKLLR